MNDDVEHLTEYRCANDHANQLAFDVVAGQALTRAQEVTPGKRKDHHAKGKPGRCENCSGE